MANIGSIGYSCARKQDSSPHKTSNAHLFFEQKVKEEEGLVVGKSKARRDWFGRRTIACDSSDATDNALQLQIRSFRRRKKHNQVNEERVFIKVVDTEKAQNGFYQHGQTSGPKSCP